MVDPRQRVTLRLPPDLLAAAQQRADAQDISLNLLVERLLRRYVNPAAGDPSLHHEDRR